MDSQSVKTTEESGGIKGYDGGQQVKGRKRHLLVDTLGLLLSVYVTPGQYLRPGGGSTSAGRAQALARRFQLDFTFHVFVVIIVFTRNPIFFDHGTFHDMHMVHTDTLCVV
jgi:transposase